MSYIAVLTSGGDSPGMNAAVTAVARAAHLYNMELLGVDRGFKGLLGLHPETDFIKLDIDKALDLADLPGTYLRTARCKEFVEEPVQAQAAALLKKMDVAGVIVIGGDGSFHGAQALYHHGIPCIGIPGTIDNDLAYTEMTLGYDTAVNCCVEAIRSIRATSRSHDRPHVVEVMGRNCGDIALTSAASTGAEIVICPEADNWSVEQIAHRLQSQIDSGDYRSTIVVAEGAWEKMLPFDHVTYLRQHMTEKELKKENVLDGEKMCANRLANVLSCMCKMPDGSQPAVRATVLGYVQRGNHPTARDAEFAFEAGIMAVNMLKNGDGNKVIGVKNGKVYAIGIDEALSVKPTFRRQLYNTINGL